MKIISDISVGEWFLFENNLIARSSASTKPDGALLSSSLRYNRRRRATCLVEEKLEDRIRNNVSEPLDRTCAGRVLPKRDVSSHLIIIGRIFRKNSPKVLCVEYYQMLKTFVSDRPDQALNISVLPGRAERGGPIPDAHCSHAGLECDS